MTHSKLSANTPPEQWPSLDFDAWKFSYAKLLIWSLILVIIRIVL
jgi:hypothetical protein